MQLTRRRFLEAASGAVVALGAPGLGKASPQRFEEYRGLDAVALAALVRSGEADPLELLDLAIARAEAVDGQINAITVRHFELARETIKAGLPSGALRGVPYLLKDLGIGLAGTVTTEGSRFFADRRHDSDLSLIHI